MSPEEVEAWKRARENTVMDEAEAKEWLGPWGSRLVAFREAGLVRAQAIRHPGGFETHMYIQRNLREQVAGWVTEDEAQQITGRQARTLRRWRAEGLVEARPLGRSWVYRLKSLKVAYEAMAQNAAESRKYGS
ncbi:helix-turn-helix domain-containing protein [Rhodococcus tibetensis]|uniref:Helix-turn-helix domain-containing protein n=1 Tax=Rhodococcus tibetensis TaxID=2965064 RepID=A0ABT1QAG6_9NOCA|nr:helix-turn-helix domain-containing protein [Rhodococcus sp. FXJ9.536]MCQ4118710.1 helix-turn-helix domain-containing protein [Rhodococcus sp. FXJ9.536]